MTNLFSNKQQWQRIKFLRDNYTEWNLTFFFLDNWQLKGNSPRVKKHKNYQSLKWRKKSRIVTEHNYNPKTIQSSRVNLIATVGRKLKSSRSFLSSSRLFRFKSTPLEADLGTSHDRRSDHDLAAMGPRRTTSSRGEKGKYDLYRLLLTFLSFCQSQTRLVKHFCYALNVL